MRVTPIIKDVLRDNPKARDSDKELLLDVWQTLGLYLTIDQRAIFRNMPSTETIRRIRQKIQEKGEFQAAGRVTKSRRIKSYEMQQNAPQATPERIEQVIEQPGLFPAQHIYPERQEKIDLSGLA